MFPHFGLLLSLCLLPVSFSAPAALPVGWEWCCGVLQEKQGRGWTPAALGAEHLEVI